MIPWDNVTISARAPITKANKRLRSLTVGAGRHGMAVSRGLVAQNGRCIRCFASPLTNRASACGMAAQAQIDQPRINGTPLQTPPCLQYTAHASCSEHRSVVPGDASGRGRAPISPTCSGFSFWRAQRATFSVVRPCERPLLTNTRNKKGDGLKLQLARAQTAPELRRPRARLSDLSVAGSTPARSRRPPATQKVLRPC